MYYDPMSYIVSLRARDIEDIFKDYGYNDVYVTCVHLDGISFILKGIDNIKKCNILDICDDISDDISNILCNQQESILKEYNTTPEKYPWCTPGHIQRMNDMEEVEELKYSRVSTESKIEQYFKEKRVRVNRSRPDSLKALGERLLKFLEERQLKAQHPLPLSLVEEGIPIEKQIEDYAKTQIEDYAKKKQPLNLSNKKVKTYVNTYCNEVDNEIYKSSSESVSSRESIVVGSDRSR